MSRALPAESFESAHRFGHAKPPTLRRRLIASAACLAVCLAVSWLVGSETLSSSDRAGIELATPISVSPGTRTVAGRAAVERDFRARHYLGAYLDDTSRFGPMDPRGREYIELWIEIFWGEPTVEQHERFRTVGRELLAEPAERHDSVLLQTLDNEILVPAANERLRLREKMAGRSTGQNQSPYARFCSLAVLAADLPEQSDRIGELDAEGLVLLKRAITDGSLPPSDQETLADNLLVNRWGGRLLRRRSVEVQAVFAGAGESWTWLATLLEGEVHRRRAWDARGHGWASEVSEAGGNGFRSELAKAEIAFERAWRLDPSRPLSAARLIAVNMGQSDEAGLRRWFERALAAQIDHPQAWRAYRQALTRRWQGGPGALLALADTALSTGRFDSEAPREILATLDELAKDLNALPDHRIYGREDLWPRVSRMFEGYLATELSDAQRARWRSDYARAAYAAGHLDVARTQLEALGWRPVPQRMWEWHRDFSNMPADVAGRAQVERSSRP